MRCALAPTETSFRWPRFAPLVIAAFVAAFACGTAGAAAYDPRAAPNVPLPAPDRRQVIERAARGAEHIWKAAANPPGSLSSRELFADALAMAEANKNLDRLGSLFDVAVKMQDRDPKSKAYGNFRWSWKDDKVLDYNAVEFSMQGGALLWMRHRDRLPADARKTLKEILDYAVEGCLRHKVSPSYTNIALMNAANLILLGETLDLPKAADEGYARLDRMAAHTRDNGIAEYGSPTYYGVDLDDLVLIEAFCKRDEGRRLARTLLELFWTDIALNFFPPSQRLAGPHSRDYDYLHGHGPVDTHLWTAGWLPGDVRGTIWTALGRWQPSPGLYEMSRSRFPRLIQQSWGPEASKARTHYLLRDVTLGSAGANYHNMDLPLTVDLPGAIDYPRCYFIPDARHDPYGQAKIPEGTGAHEKTLHLKPFWMAAQRRTDALGVVLYRDDDQTKKGTTLESHFVMPRDVDGFWIGDRRIQFAKDAPATFPFKGGDVLVLRKGTAAVGVRLPWALGVGGKETRAALVYDGNKYGAVRLTITHYDSKAAMPSVVGAGAAFWVRIGGGLATEMAFQTWCRQFAAAKEEAQLNSGTLRVEVAGIDGPLSAEVDHPNARKATVDPPLVRAVLALDGEDIGRKILEGGAPAKVPAPAK